MMAKGKALLGSVFDDETAEVPSPAPTPEKVTGVASEEAKPRERRSRATQPDRGTKPRKTKHHGDKRPVLIHIPADMHSQLRQLSVLEREPLTVITERVLRLYLVSKGYTKYAPEQPSD